MSVCKQCCTIVGATAVAALVAGTIGTAVQHLQVIPLIVQAEAYEGGGNASIAAFAGNNTKEAKALQAEAAAMQAESWAPETDAMRHFCTWVSDVLIAFGFGLVLMGCYFMKNSPVGGPTAVQPRGSEGTVLGLDVELTVRAGVVWGAIGFLVFGLAPGLGLTPELPGMMAEELGLRQTWWIMTAACTALGLWCLLTKSDPTLLCFGTKPKTYATRALGVLLLLLCHVVGAPHHHKYPDGDGNRPPPELGAQFVACALVAQLVFWVGLGVSTAVCFNAWCDTGAGAAMMPREMGEKAAGDCNGQAEADNAP